MNVEMCKNRIFNFNVNNLAACLPEHTTPTSSLWLQSCFPQPGEEQLHRDVSFPSHSTSSSHMGPEPGPNQAGTCWLLRATPHCSCLHTTWASLISRSHHTLSPMSRCEKPPASLHSLPQNPPAWWTRDLLFRERKTHYWPQTTKESAQMLLFSPRQVIDSCCVELQLRVCGELQFPRWASLPEHWKPVTHSWLCSGLDEEEP